MIQNTSEHNVRSYGARSLLRPWSQEHLERLPADENSAVALLESHDRHASGAAAHSVEVGQALNLLAQRGAYKRLSCNNINDLCQAFHSIGARMGWNYRQIAADLSLELVGHTTHGPTSLMAIRAADEVYRRELLVFGSGRTVAEIVAARKKAEACSTPEAGLAAIRAALTKEPAPPVKLPPILVHHRAITRAGQQAIQNGRRLGELLDQGHTLPPEQERQLRQDLGVWIADLMALLGRIGPHEPAEERRHIERDPVWAKDAGPDAEDALDPADDSLADDNLADPEAAKTAAAAAAVCAEGEADTTPTQQTTDEDAAVQWTERVIDRVKRYLPQGEELVLQAQLVLALMGGQSYPLAQYVRTIFDRMEADQLPDAQLDEVDRWLACVAHPDIEVRWPDIYNFFVLAQLPDFVEHLHFLEGADLSELPAEHRATLAAAWRHWPWPMPPLPQCPAGVDPAQWAQEAPLLQHRAFLRERLEAYFSKYEGRPASIQGMALLWEALRILRDRLDAEERQIVAILGDEVEQQQ